MYVKEVIDQEEQFLSDKLMLPKKKKKKLLLVLGLPKSSHIYILPRLLKLRFGRMSEVIWIFLKRRQTEQQNLEYMPSESFKNGMF